MKGVVQENAPVLLSQRTLESRRPTHGEESKEEGQEEGCEEGQEEVTRLTKPQQGRCFIERG
jgi:flagellar biosynthesis/type III secretory pathway protein FliH